MGPSGTAPEDLLLVMRCDLYEGNGRTPIGSELAILGPVGTEAFRLDDETVTLEATTASVRYLGVDPVNDIAGVQALDGAGSVIAEEPVAGVQDVSDIGDVG
ncbi:hypothetical protein BH20ACT5_BH20ACT5_08260 [soil metagenome]